MIGEPDGDFDFGLLTEQEAAEIDERKQRFTTRTLGALDARGLVPQRFKDGFPQDFRGVLDASVSDDEVSAFGEKALAVVLAGTARDAYENALIVDMDDLRQVLEFQTDYCVGTVTLGAPEEVTGWLDAAEEIVGELRLASDESERASQISRQQDLVRTSNESSMPDPTVERVRDAMNIVLAKLCGGWSPDVYNAAMSLTTSAELLQAFGGEDRMPPSLMATVSRQVAFHAGRLGLDKDTVLAIAAEAAVYLKRTPS